MASITYSPGTVIPSTWLNPVDLAVYGVERFGAVGNGVADDTAALLAAGTACAASGDILKLQSGKTYKFSQITWPANLRVTAVGAVLRSDGSLTGSNVSFTIGAGSNIDELTITTPGTETNTDILSIGNTTRIGLLTVTADSQRAGGGIITLGQDVQIGRCVTNKIDRPFHVYNTGGAATTGFYMGSIDSTSYVRAFRTTFTNDWFVGRIAGRTLSPNGSNSPGHNTVLIVGSSDWEIGSIWGEDAGEHCFRIGGSDLSGQTKNWKINTLTAIRPGGCALKVNPTDVSLGVNEQATNGTVGRVVGIDVGNNVAAGNKELLRLTHVRKLDIGSAVAYRDGATFSGQYGILANDCRDVTIGSLYGDNFNAGFVNFDYTSDISGGTVAGDILNFTVKEIKGTCAGNNAIGCNMTGFNVGNVILGGLDVTGFATALLNFAAGTLTNPFVLEGRVYGAVAPVLTGATASDLFVVDISYGTRRQKGRAASVRSDGTSVWEVTQAPFNPANTFPTGNVANVVQGTAGSGNYGGSYEFTRIGSARRGGAVALVQTGANQENTGVGFFTGNAVTASDQVIFAGRFNHEAALQIIDGIGAPATAAGWASIYVDTADGDLKVKFGDGVVKTLATDT